MIWLLWLPMTLAAPGVFPLVDPGLFVISGVRTCGGGGGYCLLGLDCTLDEDFIPDDAAGQHCEGLRSAFTPSAHFVCCRTAKSAVDQNLNVNQSELPTTPQTTTLDILDNQIDQVLLKVAESINAAKKTPSTEHPQVTDVMDTEFELRESAEEASSSQESSLQDQLMADSPEINSSHEVVENKTQPEVIIQGSMKTREDLTANEQKNEKFPSKNSVTILTESSSQESTSKEKTSVENTVLPTDSSNENMSNESDSEEFDQTTVGSSDSNTGEENSTLDNTNEIHGVNNVTEKEVVIDSHKNVSQTSSWFDNSTKSTNSIDTSEDQALSKVIPLQNDVTIENKSPKDKINRNSSVIENTIPIKKSEVDDLNSIVTPKPDLSVDQVTDQVEQTNDTEWIENKINTTTRRPIIEKAAESLPEITKSSTNTIPNEIIKHDPLPSDKSKTDDDVTSTIKKNEVPLDDDVKEQTTLSLGTGDISVKAGNGTTGNGFVPKPSVSPVNGGEVSSTAAPDVQGQAGLLPPTPPGPPAAAVPCAARAANDGNCSVEVRFIFQQKTLCLGGVYSTDWIVTSASCALRVFRAGMINVNILPQPSGSQNEIKTIIVHEAYAESAGASGQQIEANNIGLVQLVRPAVDWSPCVSCLPDAGQDLTGHNCTTAAAAPAPAQSCATPGSCRIRRRAEGRCGGVARLFEDDHGFPFLTLACAPWAPRLAADPADGGGSAGAPLLCDGVLAGVQATRGTGLTVYTPLSRYAAWLTANTRPGQPEQTFNLGR